LFSEGKSPIEVVIGLDLPAHYIESKYREYWECKRMFKLAQIYEEAKYDLQYLLRLHRIFKELGVEEHDIRNVFQLIKEHQLEQLQGKVEYLRNEINMLEVEKTKATNHLLVLNRRRDEFQATLNMYESPWAQKTGRMAYMNQETEWYDNTGNLYPTYPEPFTNSYSQLSNSDAFHVE
jgi:hypothetical protein